MLGRNLVPDYRQNCCWSCCQLADCQHFDFLAFPRVAVFDRHSIGRRCLVQVVVCQLAGWLGRCRWRCSDFPGLLADGSQVAGCLRLAAAGYLMVAGFRQAGSVDSVKSY